ncbi:unnamed protein product [Pleuronectes platessa]|uniref:Uncharacterized protein n=1 Tax=Pleuronectes platessa TaxID=8262 RepID=A0A9N7TQ21_PLEPL|nr:unnamed protein product [Pleuronectes platessa]
MGEEKEKKGKKRKKRKWELVCEEERGTEQERGVEAEGGLRSLPAWAPADSHTGRSQAHHVCVSASLSVAATVEGPITCSSESNSAISGLSFSHPPPRPPRKHLAVLERDATSAAGNLSPSRCKITGVVTDTIPRCPPPSSSLPSPRSSSSYHPTCSFLIFFIIFLPH